MAASNPALPGCIGPARDTRKDAGAAAVAPALSALREVCAAEDRQPRADSARVHRARKSPMTPLTLHPTPRAGVRCAPTRRSARSGEKRGPAPRATADSVARRGGAVRRSHGHDARRTRHRHLPPNTIRISCGPRRVVSRDGLVQPGFRCALRRSTTLRVEPSELGSYPLNKSALCFVVKDAH